jgi:hypothetical protein
MCRLVIIATLLLAAVVAVPAAARAQSTADVIATVDRPTPIAAYDGRVVWSQRTADGRAFQLMTWAGGVTATVPIAPRRIPFDVDLGPAPDGSPVAVYSRCRTEGVAGGHEVANYLGGRGCDIYRYDFADGTESKVDAASAPRASEAWPTFWRPRLAFARVYDNKRAYPYIYVNDLSDRHGSQRMPGGQRNTCERDRRTGRTTCTDNRRSMPLDLELYGRRLAFAWRYTDFAEGFAYDVRLDDVRAHDGNPRRLARQGGGGLTEIVLGWPAFASGRIFWSAACFGDPGGCPHRRALVRTPYLGALDPQTFDPVDTVFSHDRDGELTYMLVDPFGGGGGTECRGDPDVPGGTCRLVRLAPDYR